MGYNTHMARLFEGKEYSCIDCGHLFKRSQSEIKRGRIKYCSNACHGKSQRGHNNPSYKHGNALRGKHTPEYRTWVAMIDRCYTTSSSSYAKYGGKGIKVCDMWRNSFSRFLDDMGNKPSSGCSIDRIDGSRGYYPDNCRWATKIQQTNNQKSNIKVCWDGQVYNVSQLMRKLGIYTRSGVYYTRLNRGWSVKRAFTEPINGKK